MPCGTATWRNKKSDSSLFSVGKREDRGKYGTQEVTARQANETNEEVFN
jgi:hypothetical protein